MEKIAVIIPAFNAEKTLGKCIDSVKMQSYTNWEIFVINDGSTDNTKELLDVYCASDNRIHAINIPNRGVFQARKHGIDAAKTCDWLIFIDSDDHLLEKELFITCINELEKEHADCICFNYIINNRKGFDINQKFIIDSKQEAVKNLLNHRLIDGNMPYALYKYSIVSEHFKVLNYNNDDYINKYHILINSKRIIIYPIAGYFYYSNPNSQTHRDIQQRDVLYYKHVNKFTKYIENEYPHLKEECEYFRYWVLLWIATQLSKKSIFKDYKMYPFIMYLIKKNKNVYRMNKYFTKRNRLDFELINFHLFLPLYTIFSKIKTLQRKIK